MNSSFQERIAKKISRAGLCSRREAEKLIKNGRIKLNGEIILTPAINVSENDILLFDNKPIQEKKSTRLWRFHKPKGFLVTNSDPKGRPIIYDILPKSLPRVISIGRLDFDTEGLILLTNDGELARKIELPSTGWIRKYRVRVHGKVKAESLKKLVNEIQVASFQTKPIEANLDIQKGSNAWITISLKEGKNRQIRKAMEFLGYPVNRLIRTSYGPFQLGNLVKGEILEIKKTIVLDQIWNKWNLGNEDNCR